ncbi:hypothetical protein ACQKWADRAFT_322626 [Trichoderma austrokoningii]
MDDHWQGMEIIIHNRIFLVSHPQSAPDITKPYLTADYPPLAWKPKSGDLYQLHRFPDILSLGILLLEIASGRLVKFEQGYDRCHVALQCFKKWECNLRSRSITVPDGLHQAIRACIEPTEFSGNHFERVTPINDFTMREYIFQKILHPLGEELTKGYEISLSALHDDIAMEKKKITGTGSFDHDDDCQFDKQQAAEEWRKHLTGVHDLVYLCMEQCEKMTKRDRDSTRVKIAMLDTGLQLPKSLQLNYEAEGRISVEASESFLSSIEEATDRTWRIDCDGHGSHKLTCTLQGCSSVEVIWQTLIWPLESTKAIDRATNEWEVDMIVMCFGFDSPIPLIRDAIIKASKVDKPPLFFAATRNSGPHVSMAWPARYSSIIGISSTTGDGSRSRFSSLDDDYHPIFYAFGEGVPVQSRLSDDPESYATRHVSGTSYATPPGKYERLPTRLQAMDGMLAVLKHHMCKQGHGNLKSLLPWSFLTPSRLENNKLLEDISETIGQ